MNNKTILVIQTFLVPILLPANHVRLPPVHPGCQSDISVFLKMNGGTKREERAMIRSFTGEVCCLWWQGSTISFVTPRSYFCTYSTTVLFLFAKLKDESCTTGTHTCRSPKELLFVTQGLWALSALHCLWGSRS